jgi:hypothetical protein
MSSLHLTREEEQTVRKRVLIDAYERLVIGPGQALVTACGTVFGIGCFEGWCHLNKNSSYSTFDRLKFVFRYGFAQIVPSLVWGQQPALRICEAHNIDPSILSKELPAKRILAINHLNAIRGAIAGTVLIAQVVSFAGVSSEAKKAYSRRVELGREPPLHVATNDNRDRKKKGNPPGVVIRLAGKTSDVTSLTMRREGRRFIFPVYEDSLLVQPLLKRHGIKRGNDYVVPIYWQVDDGQYGHPESWSDLTIPQSWLFEKINTDITNKKRPSKLLILEADADHDGPDALSLATSKDVRKLDLNLYEVAQGFYQLQKQVTTNQKDPSFETMCVLLVDTNAKFQRGGGEEITVREYVSKLGLADVMIDSQAPVLLKLQSWLENRRSHRMLAASPMSWWAHFRGGYEVILECPEESWFCSMKDTLKLLGYQVIDISEALRMHGTAQGIPMLVYEKTTQDTIHTIRRLVKQNIVLPEDVCALCPTHRGLMERQEMDKDGIEITNICSSDLYDKLFQKVREAAVSGQSKQDIQNQLDNNLEAFLIDNECQEGKGLCIKL